MDYPIKKGTPAKPAKNSISPTDAAKKKNAGLQMSLFDSEKNKIDGATGYGKTGKGGVVDKSVNCLETNSVFPDNKCC